MHELNIAVQNFFVGVRTPFATELTYLLSIIFDFSIPNLTIVLCFGALIYLLKGRRYSILFLSAMFAGAVISYVLKLIFDATRPADAVISTFGSSFPSYHATMATVFFGLLMYILGDTMSVFWRRIFNLFCILGVIFVSLSRLYLGVHWLSDVLSGVTLGALICFVFVKKFNGMLKFPRVNPKLTG